MDVETTVDFSEYLTAHVTLDFDFVNGVILNKLVFHGSEGDIVVTPVDSDARKRFEQAVYESLVESGKYAELELESVLN